LILVAKYVKIIAPRIQFDREDQKVTCTAKGNGWVTVIAPKATDSPKKVRAKKVSILLKDNRWGFYDTSGEEIW
jgi:hypothetical protein